MAGLLQDHVKDILVMAIPDKLLQATTPERLNLIRSFHGK